MFRIDLTDQLAEYNQTVTYQLLYPEISFYWKSYFTEVESRALEFV